MQIIQAVLSKLATYLPTQGPQKVWSLSGTRFPLQVTHWLLKESKTWFPTHGIHIVLSEFVTLLSVQGTQKVLSILGTLLPVQA